MYTVSFERVVYFSETEAKKTSSSRQTAALKELRGKLVQIPVVDPFMDYDESAINRRWIFRERA